MEITEKEKMRLKTVNLEQWSKEQRQEQKDRLLRQLRELFRAKSNCYADTWTHGEDGKMIEGNVIQAITEDRFIELMESIF